MSKQANAWTPGPDLAYLVTFLESNLPEIADSTGYDVAAVAGDAASLGRIVREAPQMVEALRDADAALNILSEGPAEPYAGIRRTIRAALRAAGVSE